MRKVFLADGNEESKYQTTSKTGWTEAEEKNSESSVYTWLLDKVPLESLLRILVVEQEQNFEAFHWRKKLRETSPSVNAK